MSRFLNNCLIISIFALIFSCTENTKQNLKSVNKDELKSLVSRDLNDYHSSLLSGEPMKLSKYIHPAAYKYSKYKHSLNDYQVNQSIIQSFNNLNNILKPDSLIFKWKLLNDGIYLNDCYVFFIKNNVSLKNYRDISFGNEILLAISENKGNNWKFISSYEHLENVLSISYDEKVVDLILLEKSNLFSFNISEAEDSLKKSLSTFYSSLINFDTISLKKSVAEAVSNLALFKGELPNLYGNLIDRSKKIYQLQVKKKAVVDFEIGKSQQKAIENNTVFYLIDGKMIINFIKKDTTTFIEEKFLGISEDSGKSWKFLNFDPNNNKELLEVLSTRYSENLIRKITN